MVFFYTPLLHRKTLLPAMTEKYKQPPMPAKPSPRRFFKCFLHVPVFEAGALFRERGMTGESVILSGRRTVKNAGLSADVRHTECD